MPTTTVSLTPRTRKTPFGYTSWVEVSDGHQAQVLPGAGRPRPTRAEAAADADAVLHAFLTRLFRPWEPQP